MSRFAPRYPDRLFELIETLDDEKLSLAEVARRVGTAAVREGITRPSAVHVRALLAELRAIRRDERELRAADVEAFRKAFGPIAGDPWLVQQRAQERVGERARRRGR